LQDLSAASSAAVDLLLGAACATEAAASVRAARVSMFFIVVSFKKGMSQPGMGSVFRLFDVIDDFILSALVITSTH
jgi:hypothetical protein